MNSYQFNQTIKLTIDHLKKNYEKEYEIKLKKIKEKYEKQIETIKYKYELELKNNDRLIKNLLKINENCI
jgi:hypothetical protein